MMRRQDILVASVEPSNAHSRAERKVLLFLDLILTFASWIFAANLSQDIVGTSAISFCFH